MTSACLTFGCGAPVAARGRCAKHAGQVDTARSIGADRQAGKALYASREWRELRALVLGLHPWCMCVECVAGCRRWRSTVVHHVKAHHGDRRLFFDPTGLMAMAKRCHDALTAGGRAGSLSEGSASDFAALPCRVFFRESGPGADATKGGSNG